MSMNRAFYSLPDLSRVGLKWKQFESCSQHVRRIETRLRETQKERARLEGEIRDLEAVMNSIRNGLGMRET